LGSAQPGDRPWAVPVGEGIAHMGWLANPAPVIAGADVLVTASRREGFPMVVAEALLVGVPVVSVTNRGSRQIQRTAGSDRLVLVGNDAKALAEAMLGSLSLSKRHSIDAGLAYGWSEESAVRWHTSLISEVLG
jgi:glycosyltransferase involved in cell wall biosynthesis